MGLVLKYVVITEAGTWHYRRRVPKDVAEAAGRGEFKRLLGSTEREALRKYPSVNAEFERLVEGTRRQIGRRSNPTTPLEVHKEAEIRAREIAETSVWIGGQKLSAGDPEAADILRDNYLSSFPTTRRPESRRAFPRSRPAPWRCWRMGVSPVRPRR
jgi:hypothetical protein